MIKSGYVIVLLILIASVLLGRVFKVDARYFYLIAITLFPICLYIRKNRILTIALILIAISSMLVARSSQTVPPSDFNPEAISDEYYTFTGLVSSAPQMTAKSTQVIIEKVSLSSDKTEKPISWYGKIALVLPRHADIKYGDIIKTNTKLRPLSNIPDEGYREYLRNHNIYGTLVWPEISIISRNNGNKIVATGIQIQNYLNKQYQKVLPKDAAAFLSGVVLGSKQELTEGFDDSLKITGTTHIIVASGYNISILIGVLLKIFHPLRKFTLAIIVTIALICFVAISGWDASIIRASIMASLAMVATTLGRQNYALYCLMATAVIMLIINPMWLLDTGFQLSFLATAGIILFQSEIIKKLSILPGWVSESLSTTVSAQILVLPIIAVTFGQISLVSLITNVLVLWITPVLMFGGMLLSIVMIVSYSLGSMLALIIYPAFWYVKQIISITAQIPFAILTMKLGWATVALYYVIVYLIYWRWNNNEQI